MALRVFQEGKIKNESAKNNWIFISYLIVAVGGFFGWVKWEDKRDRESVLIEIRYAYSLQAAEARRTAEGKSDLEWLASEHSLRTGNDLNPCPKSLPLRVKVINRSKRIVDKVNFNVVAKAVGRSNDLVRFYDARHDFDLITSPNHESARCYALPTLTGGPAHDLIWTTIGKFITFRKGKLEILEDCLGLSIITNKSD